MQRLNGTRPLARYEIASGASIIAGNIVALNADGKAVPASDAANLRVIGVAERVQNGTLEVMDGVFSFVNDTTNPLTRSDRGKACYVKDASTVDGNGGTNRVVAGVVVDVYDGEVYLEITPGAVKAALDLDTDTTYENATATVPGLVKQSAAVADCTAAGESATSAETQLNALLAALRSAGILASA